MHRPPKVRDLQLSIGSQEEVLRFDVSMDDLHGVAVVQSVGQLHYVLKNKNNGHQTMMSSAFSTYEEMPQQLISTTLVCSTF